MILLTDDEQATALRALRYSKRALEQAASRPDSGGSNEAARNLLAVEVLIQTMERPERVVMNGVWCCKCPKWHQTTTEACEKCEGKKPA